MATWASVQDVLDVTGVTVTEAELAQAGGVVEVFAGRTFDAKPAISARDLGWLKRATCWQAAWMKDQPGYLSRHQTKEVHQDGVRVVYAGYSDPVSMAATALAPLAARALRNLSWKADRTLRARHIRVPTGTAPPDWLNERSDDWHPWTPMRAA